MKRWLSAGMILAILMALGSCQKKVEIRGLELTVGFAEKILSDNLLTDMQYKWKTTKDFTRLENDLNVFVHFWHRNNLLFQDDHIPSVPTSQWEPDKEYRYIRRIYIPKFIDEFDPEFKGEETLRLVIGFYSPYDRTGKSKSEVLVKKLTVVPPPPDTPEIIYENGWYDLEIDPNAFLKQWRWTAREAVCVIDNPHRDATLVIRGGVNLEAVPGQKVIFMVNDTVLDEFVPNESAFEKTYNIKKEMLGDRDEFRLVITADKTFIPAKLNPNSKDERELGVQISFIYFR